MKRSINFVSLFVISATLTLGSSLLTAQPSSALTWGQIGNWIMENGSSSSSGSRSGTSRYSSGSSLKGGVRRVGDINTNTVRNSCSRAASRDAGSLVDVKENKMNFECQFENETVEVDKNSMCKAQYRGSYYKRFGSTSPKNGCYAF